MFLPSHSNFSRARSRRTRSLLNTTGAALLAVSAVSLSVCADGQVPAKGAGVMAVTRSVAMPDNLALGLQEMAADYNTALNSAGLTNASPTMNADDNPATGTVRTLSAARFATLAGNYPLARTDAQQRVQVEVMMDGSAAMSDLITTCQAAGCDITAQVDWYRQGTFSMWMPLGQAAALAKTKGVDSIKLSLRPHHRAGIVPGTGAKVLNALNAQTNYTTLGAGIKVGAQSDSFNKLGTTYPVHAAQDVATGDLPGAGNPEGYTTPVTVVSEGPTGAEDEGRAMLQIIHDVAPAAQLFFRTGDTSEADFASGIVALQSTYGCNVICDDIGYYDEPAFSDGILAQAIDKASAAGAVYFSSAGNDGNSGYQATFSPVANNAASQALLLSEGGITYSGITSTESAVINQYHSFGTNPDGTPILVQKVYVPKTNSSSYNGQLIFQWDDPDALVIGGIKQVTTDYDLLVFSVVNGVATYQSTKSARASNFTTNLPVETPSSQLVAGTQYEFVIVLTSRTANTGGPTRDQATHIRWNVETDASQIIADFVSPAGVESHGHPCAATCAGTAAYIYDDQFSVGTFATANYTPIVEEYSSNGPATIYFDSAGNRLATPVVRKQPLLSAVDGVSTTFFPPNTGTVAPGPTNPVNDSDGDGYPNFFGTSAAAPHAAGCAALLLSAANANGIALTPADIRSLLSSTTQGQSDQDPGVANVTAGATTFSARDRGTYADPQAYTITYNGAAGTTLTTLVFDLSPVPGNFSTTNYPVTLGASKSGTTGGTAPTITASTVTAADGVSAGTTTLTVTLANMVPGSTLSFGVAQTVTVTGGNYFLHGDQLAGATVKATDSTGASTTGTLANTFSKKWNYKTGYGLIDVNAAIAKMLGH